jgi:cell division protein FtsX
MTFIVSFAAGFYLPFWSAALVSFLVAVFIYQKPAMAYLSGFLSIFLLWGGLSWWIDAQNNSILSQKIASLFPLGGNSLLLILITAIVGAIIGGLSALSGSFFRRYYDERKQLEERRYSDGY